MKEIKTEKAPKAIGPYSQAVVSGKDIYCSGQIPINPTTGQLISEEIESQASQCLENLKNVLSKAGAELSDVLRVEIYLVDIENFDAVNQVYQSYFTGEVKPARVTVGVSALPKGALVEMSCLAKVK